MRSIRGKRILLAALALCLALLVFLFARRSVDGQMAIEREYPRRNMALSLSRGKDGVIRVEGEGKLYANDLKAMLRAEGIHSSDVRDIIVGDGITEIGYRTFHHLKYLETLKLGGSVARISPGALKYCASLKWMFLPSGLRDIGAGFLLGCDDCRVVTDAVPEAVPALENVKEAERIIAGVDSVDALRAAVGTGMKLPDALSKWWP